MQLKTVELLGFKSFAEKTVLSFGPGLTAVVGPNGSGKSNVGEAIRWVLGEQSARSLRGGKMEDVIFGGASGRRGMGWAEVSITLDNSDASLPVPMSEVTITRRIDRAGGSEYLINQLPCRLRDVQDLIYGTGLGEATYAFIGQGQVEAILDGKPEQRWAILEEAAGVTRYKLRIQETRRRLQLADQRLERLRDLKSELEQRLPALEAEAAEAVRHRHLSQALAEAEAALLADTYHLLELRAGRIAERAQAAAAALEAAANGQAQLAERLADARRLLQAAEAEVEARRRARDDAEHAAREAEHRRQLAAQRREWLTAERRRLEAEEAALAEQSQRDRLELEHVAQRLAQVNAQRSAAEASLRAQEEQARRSAQDAAAIGQRLAESRARLLEVERQLATEAGGDAGRVETTRALAEALEVARAKQEEAAEQLAEAEATTSQLAGRLHEDEARLARAQAALAALRSKQHEVRQAWQESRKKVETAQEQAQLLWSRLQALEEMHEDYNGYYQGVRAVMRGKADGRPAYADILGPVSDLIQVPRRFERALEVALGGSVQDLVAVSAEAAEAAIRELKRTRAGRATFLPLGALRQNPPTAREDTLLQLPGVVGWANRLVTCDDVVQPAVAYLLSRVLVAEDLASARRAAKESGLRVRVVTLEGEVVHPGGAMTGGELATRGPGLLTRENERRELRAAVAQAQARLADARSQSQSAEAVLTGLAQEETALQEEVRRAELTLVRGQEELQQRHRERARWQDRLAERRQEEQRLLRRQQAHAKEAARHAESAKRLVSERADCQRQIDALEAEAAQAQAAAAAAQTAAADARVGLATLLEAGRGLEREAARLRASAGVEAERLAQARARLERAAVEQAELERAAPSDAEMQALSEALRAAKAAFSQAETARRHAQEQLQEVEAAAQTATARLHQAEAAHHQVELEEARLAAERQALIERAAEQHGLDAGQLQRLPRPSDAAAARTAAEAARRELAALGSVNELAPQQLEQTRARYEGLCELFFDLTSARDGLGNLAARIEEAMQERVIETLGRVRTAFQRVFRSLFQGGQADLIATPDGKGLDIMAQPPGKKSERLTLLSGGERALAAIALLFALLEVQPAPFCVLDEIEAALDEANVVRLARFLRERAHTGQFVIITHQKATMEAADRLFGITMQNGVSGVVSVRLADAAEPQAAVQENAS